MGLDAELFQQATLSFYVNCLKTATVTKKFWRDTDYNHKHQNDKGLLKEDVKKKKPKHLGNFYPEYLEELQLYPEICSVMN